MGSKQAPTIQSEPETATGSIDFALGNNDDDLDLLDEIFMCIDIKNKGTVGCAYYVAKDEKLRFMEDVKFGGLEVVEACKLTRTSPKFTN